jgi:hypothetical protein
MAPTYRIERDRGSKEFPQQLTRNPQERTNAELRGLCALPAAAGATAR